MPVFLRMYDGAAIKNGIRRRGLGAKYSTKTLCISHARSFRDASCHAEWPSISISTVDALVLYLGWTSSCWIAHTAACNDICSSIPGRCHLCPGYS